MGRPRNTTHASGESQLPRPLGSLVFGGGRNDRRCSQAQAEVDDDGDQFPLSLGWQVLEY